MEILDYLRRQFVYDEWANREVLKALRSGGDRTERPLQLIAHILAAQFLWLERLQQKPQCLPVWPDFTLSQCETQLGEIARLWRDYLATLSPPQLDLTISYKNSQGQAWSSKVRDVLNHVIMHGAYHRGQIATAMRASGRTPAYTDFIHAVRQGLIE
jgi:uncharacterized damage-inducible protein DinB